MSDELLELAERCEKATGPDQSLERDIAEALGWRHVQNKGPEKEWFPFVWVSPDGQCDADEAYPDYTASLDAAMSLVPEGQVFCVTNVGVDHPTKPDWSSASAIVGNADDPKRGYTVAATPALALTAACLRARVEKEGL